MRNCFACFALPGLRTGGRYDDPELVKVAGPKEIKQQQKSKKREQARAAAAAIV